MMRLVLQVLEKKKDRLDSVSVTGKKGCHQGEGARWGNATQDKDQNKNGDET